MENNINGFDNKGLIDTSTYANSNNISLDCVSCVIKSAVSSPTMASDLSITVNDGLKTLSLTPKERPGRALSPIAASSVSLSKPLRLSGVSSIPPSPTEPLSLSPLYRDYEFPLCKSSSQIRLQRMHRSKRKQTVVNKYCEEMNELNEAANSRPRNALIHSIQQENRHIRELQRENKELRLALEEHQNIMELIMSKYRQQIAKLVSVGNGPNSANNSVDQAMMASQMEKISEMVAVMRKAASLGEDEYCDQQKAISTLAVENKGLREMLQIACKSGSIPPAIVSDAHTQTESAEATLDDLSPELDSPNRNPGILNGPNLQS